MESLAKIGEYVVWCFREENFNIFIQLLFPFIGGTIGGWASYAIMKRDGESFDPEKLKGSKYLYVWVGGLAGFLAVNLLNPSGNIGQVLVLGFVAGLSGVTYLKRNALVESLEEKRMFGKVGEEKSKLIQTLRNLNSGELPTPDIDNEEEESLRREINAEDNLPNNVVEADSKQKVNDSTTSEQSINEEPKENVSNSSEQFEKQEQLDNDESKPNVLKEPLNDDEPKVIDTKSDEHSEEHPKDKKEKIMS